MKSRKPPKKKPAQKRRTPAKKPAQQPLTAQTVAKPADNAAALMAANKAAFLEAIAQVGTVSGAAQLANVNRGQHYDWLKTDEAYGTAFGDAQERFADRIRHEVARRALQGVKRDVRYQGVVVGQEVEYSDRLLELFARAKCPEFREKHEIVGAGGGAVMLQVITGVPQPDAETQPQTEGH